MPDCRGKTQPRGRLKSGRNKLEVGSWCGCLVSALPLNKFKDKGKTF